MSELLDSLETLAQTDCDTACRLMTDLWPIADRLFQHDVGDKHRPVDLVIIALPRYLQGCVIWQHLTRTLE